MIFKNKTTKYLIIITILIPIILLFSLFIWSTSSIIGIWFSTPTPHKPEITYGEFPFEIVYKLDNKTITINDVYVCEYTGIGADKGSGKHRTWKGYFKSTGEDKLILYQNENLTFACAVGYPEYYMSDPSILNYEYTPYIYYVISPNEYGGTSSGVMDIEPLLQQYKISLVSWKLSKPIQNSFD